MVTIARPRQEYIRHASLHAFGLEPPRHGDVPMAAVGDGEHQPQKRVFRLHQRSPLEQVALFEWAALMEPEYPFLGLMFAIPNGGHRHIAVARRLKAEGVKAGVPDIFLPWASDGYHGLFIELKRRKGGTVSDEQADWHDALLQAGYAVE